MGVDHRDVFGIGRKCGHRGRVEGVADRLVRCGALVPGADLGKDRLRETAVLRYCAGDGRQQKGGEGEESFHIIR